MKKLLLTLTVLASLLLTLSVAQANDPQAAKELALSKGFGVCLNTPDGKAPLPDGWSYVYPKQFFTSSANDYLYFTDQNGQTYIFTVTANQLNMASCVANARLVALGVFDGWIQYTGCYPY